MEYNETGKEKVQFVVILIELKKKEETLTNINAQQFYINGSQSVFSPYTSSLWHHLRTFSKTSSQAPTQISDSETLEVESSKLCFNKPHFTTVLDDKDMDTYCTFKIKN